MLCSAVSVVDAHVSFRLYSIPDCYPGYGSQDTVVSFLLYFLEYLLLCLSQRGLVPARVVGSWQYILLYIGYSAVHAVSVLSGFGFRYVPD